MKAHPVGPVLYLTALEDFTTKACNEKNQYIFIPKNTLVIVYTGNCQQENDKKGFNKYGNFGGGSRVCPRQALAIEIMRTALKVLLRNFNIKITNPGPEQGIFRFIVASQGLEIQFSERQDSPQTKEAIEVIAKTLPTKVPQKP